MSAGRRSSRAYARTAARSWPIIAAGAHAAAHDVADDERGPPGAELDDVVPVAADLRALDARAVVRGELEVLGVEDHRRQEAALELVGDAVLARGRLALAAAMRRTSSASRCSVMSWTLPRSTVGAPSSSRCRTPRARTMRSSEPWPGTTPALDVERRAALRPRPRSRPRRARGRRRGRTVSAPSRPAARSSSASIASRRRNSAEPRTPLVARSISQLPTRASRSRLVEQHAGCARARRACAAPGRARGWRARARAARAP